MRYFWLTLLLSWILAPMQDVAQVPFYYKIKKVSGTLYETDGSPFTAKVNSRRNLETSGCKDPKVDTLLKCLTFSRTSRKYLEHLLTTSAQITIEVTDKVGLIHRNGRYWLIAGLTGPGSNQSKKLIVDETSNLKPRNRVKHPYLVYEQNTIQLFRGSILYFYDSTYLLNSDNVQIFDSVSNDFIDTFSMDTISIEPIMYPELMYRNMKEFYYFAGVHEIIHITPSNIDDQIYSMYPEAAAFEVEIKLFKRRNEINRKRIK